MYVRKPEEVEAKWPFPQLYALHGKHFHIDLYIVGFCGKIYPVLNMSYSRYCTSKKEVKCFNMEDIDSFIEEHGSPSTIEYYRGARSRQKNRWWGYCDFRRKYLAQFFDECKKQQDSHKALFEDKRCPIFVAHWSRWTWQRRKNSIIEYNALLRPYEFFRVFDPYTAFQEIAMFMSNLAIPQDPMPVIPDELKAHSRGFDEWSFRRPPGGKG